MTDVLDLRATAGVVRCYPANGVTINFTWPTDLLDGNSSAAFATASALSAHESDTTAIHGIADTSLLLDTADIGASVAPTLNVPVVVSGTSDTLAATDSGKINRYTNSGLVTVTIPTDGTDDLADGFTCTLVAEGAAGLTLSVSGITVTGGANTTIAEGEALVVVKTATADTWLVIGGTS